MALQFNIVSKPQKKDWKSWEKLCTLYQIKSAYSHSYFLKNHVHPNTKTALLFGEENGDICCAMSLFYRHIGPFKSLVNVPFIQRSVWIGKSPCKDSIALIEKCIKNRFFQGHFNAEIPLFNIVNERVNCFLKKTENYRDNYAKDLKKNLRKVHGSTQIISEQNIQETISLYQQAYGSLNPHLKEKHYKRFKQITEKAILVGRAMNLVVKTGENKILAGLIFWKGNGQYHYVLGAPNAQGRKQNALSEAIDYLLTFGLEDHEVLDFEGSSISSVRRFYNAFGGEEETFYECKF